jgi:predicted ATP-grasp superfamily ATP-dependent carboligase
MGVSAILQRRPEKRAASRHRPRTSQRLLLTGSEHPAGLAALRALNHAGFEVWAAVQSRTALGARSRAAAGVVEIPNPRIEPDEFVTALARAADRIGAAAVLPGTEAALLALAGREGAFPDGVVLGNSPETTLRRATDKTALALLSLRAGMDVPTTRILDADGTLGIDDVTFPAMVKPLRSELYTDGRLERFEAARVEDRGEMERALAALPDGVGLVQPYIEGRLISVNGVSHRGKLYGANQHQVHRVWPDRCGQCVFAETIPMDPEREQATAAFMRELDWSGVFNLQLIERDGRDYVIDLNPRFYVSLTLAMKAGVNLPAIWVALLLGMQPEIGDFQPGMRFRQEKGDPRAIAAGLRRGELAHARDLLPRRHTVHALFSIRDPRPGLSIATDVAHKMRPHSGR